MFKEKPIAISDHRLLTSKGRIFEQFIDTNGRPFWALVDPPELNDPLEGKIFAGKAQFIENQTPKEKFDQADSLEDLLD